MRLSNKVAGLDLAPFNEKVEQHCRWRPNLHCMRGMLRGESPQPSKENIGHKPDSN